MSNIIEERRQNILQDTTTATSQRELLDVLDNLLPTIDQLVFKEPLHGDIDFAVLKDCGFNNITSILFESGDITSVRNIPTQVTRLQISNNLLTHLEDLPESLTVLDAEKNGLRELDLSYLSNLKSVNVSDNALVALRLPPGIETLNCDNNQLAELDLEGLETLKTLNCNGNPLISITNFQDNIETFKMENNPAAEIRRQKMNAENINSRDTKPNVQIMQAIRYFFETKSQYEENRKELLTRAFEKRKEKQSKKNNKENEVKTPCVYCNRPVNSIFTCRNRLYKAVCGDAENPCAFHIEIYAGEHANIQSTLNILKDVSIEEQRQDIIKIKMDTLLNYQTEKDSVRIFKETMEEYNEILNYFNKIIADYEELYFNKELNEKIKQKMKQTFMLQENMRKMLEDYKRTNVEVVSKSLSDIMLFYMQELLPEYKNLQELNYPFKEVVATGSLDNPKYIVVQKSLKFNRMDYSYGERESEVIAYIV